jgi:hypothetical protein
LVDVITQNIKPQVDAATGGGKKMSLQDDYDMGKDTGVFVYEENKNRYLKEKNPVAVVDSSAETTDNVPQPKPQPKKSEVSFAEDTEVKPIIRGMPEDVVYREKPSVGSSSITPSGIATSPNESKFADIPKGSSLEKSAEEDIAASKSVITFDQFKNDLSTNVDIPELTKQQVDRAKNALYISTLPNIDDGTKKAALSLLENTYTSVDYLRSNKDSPDIAFTRGSAVTTTEEAKTDPTLKSNQTRYAEGKLSVAKIIEGKFNNQFPNRKDQIRVEQAVIERISTGNFFNTLVENFKETGRGFAFELPKLVGEVYLGRNIFSDTIEMGIGPAWDLSKEARTEWARDYKDVFNKIGGETLADTFNNVLYEEFKSQLDAGEITPERFKQLTQTTVTLPNGETRVAPRILVDENLAYTMLNESIDQLAESEQYFMIFADNMTGMGAIVKEKGARAARHLKNVRKQVDEGIKKYSKESIKKIKKGDNKFDGMSLMETVAHLKREGIEIKVNDMLIKLALQDENVTRTIGRMLARKNELSKQLSNLKTAGVSKNNLEFIKVKQEYDSIRGKILRNRGQLRTAPYARETLDVAIPASSIQYGFTAALSGEGEDSTLDFYSAQAFGALTYALGGPLIFNPLMRGTGRVASYLSGQAGDLSFTLASVLEEAGTIFKIPRGMLLNKDVEAFDAFIKAERGTGLTSSERKAIGYIFKLGANLSEENLGAVVKSMKDYKKLEDSITSRFPPEMQGKIAKSLRTSFGQASGLMWLQGLERSAYANIDMKDLKSLSNINNIIDIQKTSQEKILLAKRSLDNLKLMVKSSDGINLDKGESTDKLIAGIENMIANAENSLVKSKGNLTSMVDESLVKLLEDPDLDINDAVHEVILKASEAVRGDLKGNLQVGSGIVQATDKVIEALNSRMKLIASNRRSPKHAKRASLAFEDLLETLIVNYKTKAKAGYKELDMKMLDNNETIDMSSLLKKFHRDADSRTTLQTFFTKNGQFWSSALNSKLRMSLNDVAARTLKKKFKDTTTEKLVKLAQTEFVGDPKRKVRNKYFISEDADALDVALWHTENGDLKAFDAVPSEIQDIYAAFRDYGYRTKDGSLGKLYADQAFEIDNLIKSQAPKYYEEHEKASAIYKSEIFDRQDGKGPLTDYLKSRAKRVTEDVKSGNISEGNFKGVYISKTPSQILKPIIQKLETYIKNDGNDELLGSDIFDDFQNLNKQLGDRTGTSPVFDLDTKEGKERFDLIKSVISEAIYSRWGRNQVMAMEKVDPKGVITLEKEMGGYNFRKMSETVLDEVSEFSMVKVKKDGEVTEMSLVDLSQMISDEKDIVKQLGYHKELRQAYKIFRVDINNKIKNVEKVVRDTMVLQDSTIQKLKELAKFKDPKSFFDNYILNGTVESIDKLKQGALSKGIPEKDFDDAIKYLTINGLVAQSNMTTLPGKPLMAMDGTSRVRQTMLSPGAVVEVLERQNVSEILDKYIDQDHKNFLMDISDYLNRMGEVSGNSTKVDGVIRPIGINEVISRAFNLARGMVSPAYVAAEFAVRIASNAGIDMMKMAAGNKEAADIMANLLLHPEKIKGVDMSKFKTLITDFVATELARQEYVDIGVTPFYGETLPDETFN